MGRAWPRSARWRACNPSWQKRHYHATGALRWFDVSIVPLVDVEEAAAGYVPRHGALGGFFLAIPTQGESEYAAKKICRRAARMPSEWDIVVGLSQSAWNIPGLAAELSGLERVRDETPDLRGDRVARTEVLARIGALQGQLESELGRALQQRELVPQAGPRQTALARCPQQPCIGPRRCPVRECTAAP